MSKCLPLNSLSCTKRFFCSGAVLIPRSALLSSSNPGLALGAIGGRSPGVVKSNRGGGETLKCQSLNFFLGLV